MAKEIIYCRDCEKDTVHKMVKRNAIGSGLGPIRVLLAVCTVGISEITTDAAYECTKCGKIVKK